MFINSVSEDGMRKKDEVCVTYPNIMNLLRFDLRILRLENI